MARVMADKQALPRPAYFRKISSYFFPQAAHHGVGPVATPGPLDESSPLLTPAITLPTITLSSSNPSDHRPDSIADANTQQRSHHLRAATAVAAVHTQTVPLLVPPLSRPALHRAATTTTAFVRSRPPSANTLRMDKTSPSLLRRATNAISQQLELGDGSSAAHRNAPPTPSNWNDHHHRRYLVKIWDSVNDVTANSSKYPKSIPAQLVGTQQTMVRMFPELSEGSVGLSREWIEYVLGVALRHPFCTAEKMGRWEVLASSGSARMNWGPW